MLVTEINCHIFQLIFFSQPMQAKKIITTNGVFFGAPNEMSKKAAIPLKMTNINLPPIAFTRFHYLPQMHALSWFTLFYLHFIFIGCWERNWCKIHMRICLKYYYSQRSSINSFIAIFHDNKSTSFTIFQVHCWTSRKKYNKCWW